jgi:hypothetical protein
MVAIVIVHICVPIIAAATAASGCTHLIDKTALPIQSGHPCKLVHLHLGGTHIFLHIWSKSHF